MVLRTLRQRARRRKALRTLRKMRRPGSASLGERLRAVPSMVRVAASGRYPDLSRSRLAMLALAAAYIVSPIDFVPEAVLLALGFADDAAVAAWLVNQLLEETDRYLAWKQPRRRWAGG
jgi:uncharacterized membrane protein YkvA (DUF1232 family)